MGKQKLVRKPTFTESVLVVFPAMVFIAVGCLAFKMKPEFLMIIAAAYAALWAMRLGYGWNELQESISEKLKTATPILLIMWAVGISIASFMMSGAIPMIVYYGLKWINPQHVLTAALVMGMLLSVFTGSSFTAIGTAGVAFMGVAAGMGIPLGIVAGASTCGALFGDKLSPLSDTTQAAPLAAETDIFAHIHSMLYTTLVPTVVAFVVFWIQGNKYAVPDGKLPPMAMDMMNSLDSMFTWSPLLLLPFVLILACSFLKKPACPTLLAASVLSLLLGIFVQGFDFRSCVEALITGFNVTMITVAEQPASILTLLNRGGMRSMVGVFTIIYSGVAYAGVVSRAGFLETALEPLLSKIKTVRQLIPATLGTILVVYCSLANAIITFLISGEIFRSTFKRLKVHPTVLSRTMEDIGVCTPLVPWSQSAAFFTVTLGVSVAEYAPWHIIGWMAPICALICGFTGIGIFRLKDENGSPDSTLESQTQPVN